MRIIHHKSMPLCAAGCLGLALAVPVSGQQLVGFASLPADTFAAGPTSGQFIGPANDRTPPFLNQQPVQGVSAILNNGDGSFLMLSDNGFGSQPNSPDYTLRLYHLTPDFRTPTGGSATIAVGDFVQLSDPNNQIPWDIVADGDNYPNSAIPVDANLKANRWLTGADFDIESFRRAPNGDLWIGDEFGPFMLHFNASGELLEAPVELPGVASPQDPLGRPATLPGSGGFEGMSANQTGTKLYPMLEKPTDADAAAGLRRLQVNEFDPATSSYTGEQFFYPFEDQGVAIGDFSPITDNLHMVIERDGGQGDTAQFKKIFLVDFTKRDAQNNLLKRELVDLLNIADPDDLDQDGQQVFTFPFVTIEDVVVIDENTILVGNDNNYPFSNGRAPSPVPDNNESMLLRFDQPLASMAVPEPTSLALLGLAGLMLTRRRV